MRSAVHISINHEINITVVRDIQNLDIMLYPRVTKITVFILAEGKNLHKLAGIRCVAPQISILRKCSHTSLFVRHVIHIFAPDSQNKPTVTDHRTRRGKNLRCRTLKIQKADSCLIISHSVKICYKIIFGVSIFIRCCDLIFNRNTGCCFIDILDDRNSRLG